MIKRVSSICARSMIRLGNVEDANEAVLRYGCELILTSLAGLLIMVTFSLLMGHPWAWVFFVLGFAPLRTSAGGYHADTHLGCYSVTTIMFVTGTACAYGLRWTAFVYVAIASAALVLVWIFAPLAASNKPLSPKRHRRNRIRSFLVIGADLAVAVLFFLMGLVDARIGVFFSGIFFAAASLIMGKIKTIMRGGRSDEGQVHECHR